jgi:hypothetical protein
MLEIHACFIASGSFLQCFFPRWSGDFAIPIVHCKGGETRLLEIEEEGGYDFVPVVFHGGVGYEISLR